MLDLAAVPLFALADRRLSWVAERQSVLAANIANADTPNWQAKDVTPFAAMLRAPGIALAQTAPGHIAGAAAQGAGIRTVPGERSPDGNSVALDKELAKVADTDAAHEIATDLTRKYLGLFRTAIGK
jgi:flagellar basal-body rod protein FlgB